MNPGSAPLPEKAPREFTKAREPRYQNSRAILSSRGVPHRSPKRNLFRP